MNIDTAFKNFTPSYRSEVNEKPTYHKIIKLPLYD